VREFHKDEITLLNINNFHFAYLYAIVDDNPGYMENWIKWNWQKFHDVRTGQIPAALVKHDIYNNIDIQYYFKKYNYVLYLKLLKINKIPKIIDYKCSKYSKKFQTKKTGYRVKE
jgi:hypothetical protein